MSWMAGGTTTLIEDITYKMLGILNIGMNPQYGEGVKAFIRLQKGSDRKLYRRVAICLDNSSQRINVLEDRRS